ncbi:MAG: hypothetical protein JEY94_03500 [Melioribacteraceae bacterium]|nr:hypothetical protein [Melioribacteraceae bacterium]
MVPIYEAVKAERNRYTKMEKFMECRNSFNWTIKMGDYKSDTEGYVSVQKKAKMKSNVILLLKIVLFFGSLMVSSKFLF